jgi:hypothetical protein
MRFAFVFVVSLFGLAGCQSMQQLGNPNSCVQAGTTVSAPVICPQ